MAWIILAISGVLEAVWATALGKSEGFSKLWPSVIFGVAVVASMIGLGNANAPVRHGLCGMGRNWCGTNRCVCHDHRH